MIQKFDGNTVESRPAGFVISSGGSWLPGIYDKRETANYAFQFKDSVLLTLRDRVNRKQRRAITKADLQEAKTWGE